MTSDVVETDVGDFGCPFTVLFRFVIILYKVIHPLLLREVFKRK
jgi:hypothetical protein